MRDAETFGRTQHRREIARPLGRRDNEQSLGLVREGASTLQERFLHARADRQGFGQRYPPVELRRIEQPRQFGESEWVAAGRRHQVGHHVLGRR